MVSYLESYFLVKYSIFFQIKLSLAKSQEMYKMSNLQVQIN